MAIYHCSIKIISRGKGKSAVAAAAYRSGTKLVNDWDGMIHDYTKKGGIVYSEILLPAHASPAYLDRSTLWNSVEQIEKSRNAQLAREIEVAIPNELPRAEQIKLVQDYCATFAHDGMCVDFSIHDPQKEQENVHAHILLTIRPFKTNGKWDAKCRKEYDLDGRGQRISDGKGGWKNHRVNLTDWNEQTKAEEWRAAWATLTNAALERNGLSERVDHRSYKRQGIEQIPTIHMGVAAWQMEKRGIVTEKGTVNREIAKQNRLLKEIKARLTRLYNWSKAQDAAAADQPSIRELLQQAQQTLEEAAPATRYGKVRALKESASLFAFLQSNGIRSMPELHEKISAMQSDYYALCGEIVKAEQGIAQRKEYLTQWERYTENRDVVKHIATLRPKAQEREREHHSAEIILYDASVQYLAGLKERGIKLTPKRWKAEIAELTASKDAKYQQMYAMREQIKAAESIRKAAEKLGKPPRLPKQPHRSNDDLQK